MMMIICFVMNLVSLCQEQLCRWGLRNIVRSGGINKYSLHLFRHTFAKMWIFNKGDIFSLQKILRHMSFKMVNHYSNLYAEDLNQNYNSFCALETVTSQERERILLRK